MKLVRLSIYVGDARGAEKAAQLLDLCRAMVRAGLPGIEVVDGPTEVLDEAPPGKAPTTFYASAVPAAEPYQRKVHMRSLHAGETLCERGIGGAYRGTSAPKCGWVKRTQTTDKDADVTCLVCRAAMLDEVGEDADAGDWASGGDPHSP